MHPSIPLREPVGTAVGWLSAPLFAVVSAARHARTFHPDGVVFTAKVEPIGDDTQSGSAGARDVRSQPERGRASIGGDSVRRVLADCLRGPALVRFSTALWRHGRERMDALGCAIRLRSEETVSAQPSAGDQDLLFATIRSPMTLLADPLTTKVHDFLANQYFATAPFDVPAVGRAKWRLTPELASVIDGTRGERLFDMASHGEAVLKLELRRTWTRRYEPVARIVLGAVADVDQAALRFNPFRTGRGIEPRGFVHALRRGAYAASQIGRPRQDEWHGQRT